MYICIYISEPTERYTHQYLLHPDVAVRMLCYNFGRHRAAGQLGAEEEAGGGEHDDLVGPDLAQPDEPLHVADRLAHRPGGQALQPAHLPDPERGGGESHGRPSAAPLVPAVEELVPCEDGRRHTVCD